MATNDPRPERITVRTAVVPNVAQSVALTREGIAATTPAALLSAPPEAVADYLAGNGPVVLWPQAGSRREFDDVIGLLDRRRVPFRIVSGERRR